MKPILSIRSAANLLGLSNTAIHKKIKAKKMRLKRSGNTAYLTFNDSRELFYKKGKLQIITFHIVKGGVGKTTTAINLALCLNAFGYRVLLIDVDPQANMTDNLGITEEIMERRPVFCDHIEDKTAYPIEDILISISEGLDLIPSKVDNVTIDSVLLLKKKGGWEKIIKNAIKPIEKNYDFVLIDCPPSLGHIVTSCYVCSNYVIAPVNPDIYSYKGVTILQEETLQMKEDMGVDVNYKIFLNRYTPKTILSAKHTTKLMTDKSLENNRFETMIRHSQEVPNIANEKSSVFCHVRKSAIRDDFEDLAKEILREREKDSE